KTLSDTRWECRVESVKAVRFQIKQYKTIESFSKEDLLKNCNNFHILLQDGQISDIDGTDLFEELLSFIQVVPENNQNFCPNIYIAIRILLTLPVTIVTAERSFLKLKLIKNYLRSNTSQERLVGLAMIVAFHLHTSEIESEVS
ncbi:hypothetical protein ALC57_00614, partial [Trachymyrmex cornetzi]